MPSLASNAVSDCNCSACESWGLLNAMAWKDDLEIAGEEFLKEYQFGKKRMTHKFCSVCSTNLFVYQTELPHWGNVEGWIGVNVSGSRH
jgi:hypothetical protein